MEITLRAWNESDIGFLVTYANNKNIAANMTDSFPYPYERVNAENFIRFANQDEPTRIFAIEADGVLCGGIGLHPQSDIQFRNLELGYWLAEPFWGKGIATAAIKKVLPIGFAREGITRIFARPFGRNIGSQKALEKAGFKLEATLKNALFKWGKFEDELIYSIQKP
jgi:RimJ/RimL family protein N-acetyltransferase